MVDSRLRVAALLEAAADEIERDRVPASGAWRRRIRQFRQAAALLRREAARGGEGSGG